MKILEHNVETGEAVERDATAEELAQAKKDQVENAQLQNEREEKAAAKAAIAERLGLTAEELATLLS